MTVNNSNKNLSSLTDIVKTEGSFWRAIDETHVERIGLIGFVIEKLKGLAGGYFGADRTHKEVLKYTFIQITAKECRDNPSFQLSTVAAAALKLGLIQKSDEFITPCDDFTDLIQSIANQAIANQATPSQKLIHEKIYAYYQNHESSLSSLFAHVSKTFSDNLPPIPLPVQEPEPQVPPAPVLVPDTKPSFAPKDLKRKFELLKTQLQPWLQSKTESKSWFGSLSSYFHSKINSFSNWLVEGFSHVPDMDARDYKILEEQGFFFLDTYKSLQSLEVAAEELALSPSELYGEDFLSLKQELAPHFLKAEFLKDYFSHLEKLENAYTLATDQELDLLQGNLDFNSLPYENLLLEIHANEELSEYYKLKASEQKLPSKIIENIDKRCRYWREWGMAQVQTLMDPLISELEAECLESVKWVETASNAVKQESKASPEQLQQYSESLSCLHENMSVCQQLITSLANLKTQTFTSAFCHDRISKDLDKICHIHRSLEDHISQLSLPKEISPVQKPLDQIRTERPQPLTSHKQSRLRAQHSFQKIDTPFSENQTLFFRFFFFYLQFMHPLVQAGMSPVGQRDYQFYLKMMREASQSINPLDGSYEHYLNMAKSFVGGEDEFLNGYDQYLRGELSVEYSPFSATSPTDFLHPPERGKFLETAYGAVQDYLPKDIADWTYNFLGLNPAEQALGNANAWGNWSRMYLVPQVRDHFFQQLGQQLEALNPAAFDESGKKGETYLYYQMHKSLKEGSFDLYQYYHEKAAADPLQKQFLHDFDTYFQEHPPTQISQIPPATSSKEMAPYNHQFTWLQHHSLATEMTSAEEVLTSALRTDAQFSQAWPTGLSTLFKPFWDTTKAGNVGENLDLIFSNTLSWMTQRNQVLQQKTLESLEKLKPFTLSTLPSDLKAQILPIQSALLQANRALTHFVLPSEEGSLAELEAAIANLASIEKQIPTQEVQLQLIDRLLLSEKHDINPLMKFLDTSPSRITDKLLLHLIGDFFGRGTSLEKIDSQTPLRYVKDTIKKIQKAFPSSTTSLSKLSQKLETAIQIDTLIKTGNIQELQRKLTLALSQLAPNESLFFPGGWTGQNSNVMYYELIAETSTDYTLRIYNSDPRLQIGHAKETLNYKAQSVMFTETVNIPLKNILRPESLQTLVQLAHKPISNEDEWNVGDIYWAWQGALGGTSSNHIFTEDELTTPQRSGTAAMMSLNAVLRAQIPSPKESRRFHWLLLLKGVLDYAESSKQELHQQIPRHLLSKSLEEVSRISVSSFEEGAISADELQLTTSKLSQVQQLINAGESKYSEILEDEAPIISYSPVASIETKSIAYTPSLPEALPEPAYIPYHSTDISNWTPTSATLLSDFNSFYKKFEIAIKDSDPIAAVNHFENILRKLPTPSSEEGTEKTLWHTLSNADSLKMVSLISKSGLLIYQGMRNHAVLNPSQQKTIEPRFAIALMKAFNIAYELIKFADPKNIPPKELFYTPVFDLLNADQTPYFRTYDPSLEDEIQEIRKTENLKGNFYNVPPFPWVWKHSYIPSYWGGYKRMEHVDNWIEKYASSSSQGKWFPFADYTFTKNKPVKLPRNIFPAYFYELRDLTAAIGALAAVPLDYKATLSNEPFKPVFLAPSYRDAILTTHETSEFMRLGAPSRVIDGPDSWLEYYTLESINHAHQIIQEKALELIFLPMDEFHLVKANEFDKEFNQKGFGRKDENTNTANRDTFSKVVESGSPLTLQATRSLYKLISHRPSQIKETLRYFLQNSGLLEEPDYQTLFKLLMFDRELLINELRQENPQHVQALIKDLAKLTKDNYDFYQKRGLPQVALFFLHTNQLFVRYATYTKTDASAFMDTREEIKTFLKQPHLPENIKAAYFQELVLSYQKVESIPPEEASEFLNAAFYSKIIGLPPKYDPKENRLAANAIFSSSLESLKTLLEGPKGNELLNGIMQTIIGVPSTANWRPNPAFPYFSTDDGAYTINIRDRSVRSNSGSFLYLPKEVSENPLVQKIFQGSIPKIVEQTHRDVYQFKKGTHVYRVLLADQKAIIQKQLTINKKVHWHEYIDEKELSETSLPLALREGHFHWISVDNPTEICITDQIKQNPLYCSFTKGTQTAFYKLDNNHNKSDFKLIIPQEDSELAKTLQRFEKSDYTLVWEKKSPNAPHSIEFPRFAKSGLHFHLKKVQNLQLFACDNFPGYHLAEIQHVPSLKALSNYLLLENANGDQKVLIPKQAATLKKFSNPLEMPACDFDRSNPNQQMVTYKVDRNNGSLIPESQEARFYLTILHLLKLDYTNANICLRDIESNLRALNPEEEEVLSWIINLKEVTQDQDPRILPISLYAGYLLQKNWQHYSTTLDKSKVLFQLEILYSTYLNQLSNIASGGLKLDEELHLLKSFQALDQAMIHRQEDLSPRKSEELLAYMPQTASLEQLVGGKVTEVSPSKTPIKVQPSLEIPSFIPSLITFIDTIVNPPVKIPPSCLLRPHDVHKYLIEGYCLARGDTTTPAQASEYYKKLTGIEHAHYSTESLKFAFKLMQPGAKETESMIILLFEALLESPDQFPSTAEFSKALADAKKEYTWPANKKKPAIDFLEQKVMKPLDLYRKKKLLLSKTTSSEPTDDSYANKRPEVENPQSLYQTINPLYQISIQPQPTNFSDFPVITNLKELGVTRSSDNSAQQKSNTPPLDDLKQALSISTSDPIIEKTFQQTLESIEKYAQSLTKGPVKYAIEDVQQFQKFLDSNTATIKKNEKELAQRERALILKANQITNNPITKDLKTLEQLGGGTQPLTLNDLIQMYWRRDASLFHVYNPDLSPEDLFSLHQDIVEYLERATLQQHLKRIEKKTIDLNEALAQNDPEANELFKQLTSLLKANRAYETSEHPEYLVLEYYADILMYQNQVDNLNLLDIRQGKIHHPEALGFALEMIMGAGKTTVLMPLLLLLHADGEHLSIGSIPEALLASMSSWMAKTMGNFKSSIVVFQFDRKMPVDATYLSDLLKDLEEIRTRRKVLFMSTHSLHSLYLKYIEVIHNLAHSKEENIRTLEVQKEIFGKIFNVFNEKGFLIIDEADKAFNPREETLYTLDTPQKLNTDEASLIEFLYKTLDQNSDIRDVMRFEFSSKDKSEIVDPSKVYDKASYLKNVVPILVDSILKHNLGVNHLSTINFFKNIRQGELSLVKNYLTLAPEDPLFLKACDYVENISDKLTRDLLALSREEILILLPLTCDKLSNQHYGPLPSAPGIIPYHGSGAPAIKSRFGSIYEEAHYTTQYYLKYDLPVEGVKEIWMGFQAAVMRILKENPKTQLEEIDAYQKFLEFTNHDPQFTLFGPLEQAQILTQQINKDISKKLRFIRDSMLSQLTAYPLVIDANPQIFSFLFDAVLAFTGTLAGDVLPEDLLVFSENTVKGKTLGLLWQKKQEEIPVVAIPRSNSFAQDLIGKTPELHDTNMLVDVGGYARGIQNEEVVKQLMQLPCYQKFKGFVFYDQSDNLMVMERGAESPKLLIHSDLAFEDLFYFLDEARSRGADTKAKRDSIAIVTIGKHTLLDEGLQGVWRLRGLDKSQRVKFVIDEEVKAILTNQLKDLGIIVGEKIKLEHLLFFIIQKQAMQAGDNNYRAFKRKLRGLLQAEVFKSFLDPSISTESLKQLYKDTEELFVTRNEGSAWEKFGRPQVSQKSAEAVKADINILKKGKAFQAFTKNAFLKEKNLQKTVENKIDLLAIEVLPKLPAELIRSSIEYGKGVEMETETEKQKEAEKQKETEKEMERQIDFNFYISKQIQHRFAPIMSMDAFKTKPIKNAFKTKPVHIITKSPDPAAFFVSLSEALTTWPHSYDCEKLQEYKDIFDERLISSNNLIPEKTLFSPGQKSVSDVLFIEEKKSGNILCAMLDQQDSFSLLEMFTNKKTESLGFNVAFQSFGLEPRLGASPISEWKMEKNPAFKSLLVQAKFFNGETHYTPSEMQHLKEWISKKGTDRMYHLFYDHILQWKDDSRLAFSTSTLGKVFEELGLSKNP